ncbi:fimbrial protein [Salmonella enterica subsp. enterica serovar Montevideo]|uniref:F4 family fimbrial subunit n=1 Tax=Salmonella TaxID=590 RepID=UPI001122197A|nr:fimbrial protein [Salmonella enterica]EBY7873578.1 fimbrial protein [Salmonella enterica subsp. enterica serovar Muenster]ECC3376898.1 fimbrial protein [Salmonella enterica subsp. enterica]ECV6032907.1 fimbrial protein [Salmonella enterica subsp. enterica serovar Montevideo]MDK9056246.1 fimbrial protein [Salmonella enterica subsp. enterica serovar Jangwani]EBO9779150.1 fimbrial protein [Salmonella enterica]
MKKTLIALAVAASAAVSGSAMAWDQDGNGGNLDMGGTLTPVQKETPWEVQADVAVAGLDAPVKKGDTVALVPVKTAIPVLGIRTKVNTPFAGDMLISPQIDYKGAVDIDGFKQGVTTLTLNINDSKQQKIGTLSVDLFASASVSQKYPGSKGTSDYQYFVASSTAGEAFFGGVAKSNDAVASDSGTFGRVTAINPEFTANFDTQGTPVLDSKVSTTGFQDTIATYSGFYGSGIESGSVMKITLDKPADAASIDWTASMPITVSYQ